eukprot:TRINITY_DN8833_c0_g1_i1.p1 TRINITY_DN8833_c0_g1~~TRINITY_DN8833_c0_g1_i1.p1  ORF type:complete len:472 (+),score=68.84 TRINITY_DN8833_c0_g1_i1:99-1514(+)
MMSGGSDASSSVSGSVSVAVQESALNPRLVIQLAVAICIMAVSGTLYAYGAYSSDLKAHHNLSDSESSRIISIANVGFCFAFFVGVVSDIGGAKLCGVCGGVLAVTGFMLIRESCEGAISDSWGALAASFALVGQGSTFLYMASLVTYQNFPKAMHGVIIGLLDCMFGFSAAIFTLIYDNGFSGNISGFMVFCAGAVGVGAVAAFIFLGVDKPETTEHSTITPASEVGAVPKSETQPLVVPEVEAEEAHALYNPQFWLLFVIFMLGQGVGLQLINNAGGIATAIRPHHSDSLSSTISLVASLAGGCLRFAFGILADVMAGHGFRVSLLLVGLYALLVLVQLLLLTAFETAIIPAALFTGMAFGGQWCVVPILTSSIFGEASFGVNWGILICASAAGPWLFEPYRAHVYSENTSGSGSCEGVDCYHDTWMVTLGAAVFALALCIYFDRWVQLKIAAQSQQNDMSVQQTVDSC